MKLLRGLNLLRALFVTVCMVLGWKIGDLIYGTTVMAPGFFGLFAGAALSSLLILAERSFEKHFLGVVASVLFGLLGGLILTAMFINLILLIPLFQQAGHQTRLFIQIALLVIFSYLGVMLVLQSRENFKFIIPFMELERQKTGYNRFLLDTSSIIDGRIIDLCKNKFLRAPLVVPKFVLTELHSLSDSSDELKQSRGRRGLDLLEEMKEDPMVELEIVDATLPYEEDVDDKLIRYAKTEQLDILSTDYNLSKVASVEDVNVINLNDLSSALQPRVIPGDTLELEIVKEGEEEGQGVGYLEDESMVVVEGGKRFIGEEIRVKVTSAIQTNAGRMIFAEPIDASVEE